MLYIDRSPTSLLREWLLALMVATITTGCATTSAIQSARDAEGASSDVITTAELKRLDPGLSMIEVVEHARPWFLYPRGSTSTVSIDDGPPAELSVLRMIRVGGVREVRLLRAAGKSAPAAIRSNGTVEVGNVILVRTGTSRP